MSKLIFTQTIKATSLKVRFFPLFIWGILIWGLGILTINAKPIPEINQVTQGFQMRGVVFYDNNRNGLYDEGEPLAEGVEIMAEVDTLDDNQVDYSYFGESIALPEPPEIVYTIYTDTTQQDGIYTFDQLPDICYFLRIVLPDGFQTFQTEWKICSNHGGSIQTNFPLYSTDSPLPTLGKVSGYAWTDRNGSGWREDGEYWYHESIVLRQRYGDDITFANIDQDGYYEIDSIIPGEYRLEWYESNEVGYNLTRGDYELTIEAGADLRDLHFMTTPWNEWGAYGTLYGKVWYDTNLNGWYDDEEEGVDTLQVLAEGDLDSWYASNMMIDSTYIDTAYNGRCRFPYLPMGGYWTSIEAPIDYQTPQTRQYGFIEMPGNSKIGISSFLSLDFPLYPDDEPLPELGSISGYTFLDENRNGIKETEETTTVSAILKLYTEHPSTKQLVNIRNVIVDSTGFFEINHLPLGEYTVRVGMIAGHYLYPQEETNLRITHEGNPYDLTTLGSQQTVNIGYNYFEDCPIDTIPYCLGAGEVIELCFNPCFPVSNIGFSADNCIYTPLEDPLCYLIQPHEGFSGLIECELYVYNFTGLKLYYYLDVNNPDCVPAPPMDCANDEPPVCARFVPDEEVNWGSISGYVWNDVLPNRWRDPHEIGYTENPRTISLLQRGELIKTTEVNESDGFYRLDSIFPANYNIKLEEPAYIPDGPRYLVQKTECVKTIFSPTTATDITDYHFFLFDYGILEEFANFSGHVWYDTNNNGEYDFNEESGAASARIFIQADSVVHPNYPNNQTSFIDTTNSEVGYYNSHYYPFGYYSVSVELPEGYTTPQLTYNAYAYFDSTDAPGMPTNAFEFNFPLQIDTTTTIEARDSTAINTGIDDPNLLETRLHAYPIPCKDFVNIYSIEFILTGYTIYNTIGQIVDAASVDPNHEIRIDLPRLTHGVYILELQTDTNGLIRREIIVMP